MPTATKSSIGIDGGPGLHGLHSAHRPLWAHRPHQDQSAPRPIRHRPGLRPLAALFVLLLCCWLSACSVRRPIQVPERSVVDHGVASWYGPKFHGRTTASGEPFDQEALTAAHKTLPFGSLVEVVNLDNGRTVQVRINDRGPFVRGRVIDLSRAAAREIGLIGPGTAKVDVVLLESPAGELYAVQAGAFRDADRALALRTQIAALTTAVEVSTRDGWHRVLVGPFASYDEARQMRRDLARRGVEAVVRRLPEEGEL